MLRRLCNNGWGALSAAETAAVTQLCSSHVRLLGRGGIGDLGDEAASAACAEFLSDIDRAARAFSLEVASRAYRADFSANYRALFPDRGRLYRVDVLETSLDRHSAIWVNGDKFELSAEAVANAEALQHAWFGLGALLDRWQAARLDDQAPGAAPGAAAAAPTAATRVDLVAALAALDVAWAKFECSYISELIAIEGRARQLVVAAVTCESRLRALVKQAAPGGDCRATERQLVQLVGQMNAVANFKCKGRDDLGHDILDSARRVLRRCADHAGDGGLPAGAGREGARVLAADIVGSYDAMRHYLRHVGACIERVDPHLCNNAGLVARLVDWETSWEVGARYVREAPLLEALCDLVSQVKAAQELVPALVDMFEDCDVELFLVLPRIIMLFFAAHPMNRRAELVNSLLPHRFRPRTPSSAPAPGGPGPAAGFAAATVLSPELQALSEQYTRAARVLEEACPASPATAAGASTTHGAAWEVLVKRAVLGNGCGAADGVYSRCPPAATQVVEDLMRELERWSLELQRHCPQDWNQCSAVLVQCITGRSKKQAAAKFQV